MRLDITSVGAITVTQIVVKVFRLAPFHGKTRCCVRIFVRVYLETLEQSPLSRYEAENREGYVGNGERERRMVW